jgi:RNA polymerase nonessential primary-like sigma factor
MTSDSVRDYLKNIGSVPLLTSREEIELGRLVQRRQRLIEAFPGLEDSAAVAAAAMAAEGLSKARLRVILRSGKKAKDRMVAANMRLCVKLATKNTRRAGPSLEMVDLAQEGALGLIRATELFDPERGYKFSTFAYWHINQRITVAIADKSTAIRIPRHIREGTAKINKIQANAASNGSPLTMAEAAKEAGVNPALIDLAFRTRTLSLDALLHCSTDTELQHVLPAPQEEPSLLGEEQISLIRACVDALPGERPQVLRAAYAITGNDEAVAECSNTEIAARMNLARSRIWELRSDSSKMLRVQLESLRSVL